MTTSTKSAPSWLAWLPVITTLFLIAGFLWAGGGKMQQLADHESRIAKLEVKSDARDEKLNVIDVRTARIETKLDMLVPSPGDSGKAGIK